MAMGESHRGMDPAQIVGDRSPSTKIRLYSTGEASEHTKGNHNDVLANAPPERGEEMTLPAANEKWIIAAPFYVTGGTVPPDAPSYVERQADKDLLSALLAGEYCYVLNTRQMGKSSLSARALAVLLMQR
jgi:hypothetical protein